MGCWSVLLSIAFLADDGELGMRLLQRGRYDEALTTFRQQIEQHPTVSALFFAGTSLLMMERLPEAAKSFRRC
jgi:TolA-binding protein